MKRSDLLRDLLPVITEIDPWYPTQNISKLIDWHLSKIVQICYVHLSAIEEIDHIYDNFVVQLTERFIASQRGSTLHATFAYSMFDHPSGELHIDREARPVDMKITNLVLSHSYTAKQNRYTGTFGYLSVFFTPKYIDCTNSPSKNKYCEVLKAYGKQVLERHHSEQPLEDPEDL